MVKLSIKISKLAPSFTDVSALLALLHRAFAFQHDLIDPPSSLHLLDEQSLAEKINQELVLVAQDAGVIAGCIFIKWYEDYAYFGKHAVEPSWQHRGIGKQLIQAAEQCVLERGFYRVMLQVRVELVENQLVFAKMGFVKSAETSHPGYKKVTSITMTKNLAKVK